MATAHSKIGFHTAVGGNKSGLGDWERKLNAAGIPFFIKSADEYGILAEALAFGEQYGVDNWLVYRVVLPKPYDVPNYYIDPRTAADEYWQRIITIDRFPPEFDKSSVWLDVLNEPRAQEDFDSPNWNDMHPVAWLGAFSCRIGEIAMAGGWKVCLPSFNSGEPNEDDYEHPEWLAFMQMCGDYPDRVALSVHEYAWNLWENDPNPANWYPHLWGRMENFIAACDYNDISRDITIFGTEFGWGHDGHTIPPVAQGMEFLRWYDQWAAQWPQIKGVALWSLQSGWADVANAIQPYIAPLTDYQLQNEFDMGEQPAMTYLGTLPGDAPTPPVIPNDGTTAEKIYNISQEWAFPVNEDAALQAAALADGFTPSGAEQWKVVDGKKYAMQPFYKIGTTNKKRSYYAIIGNWQNVMWTDGTSEPSPPDPPTPPTPPPSPPTGQPIAIAPYFTPRVGDVGVYVVFHFDNGSTQAQQMIRQPNGRIIMFKGEGQWIDGQLMQDYEEWTVGSFGVRKWVDTSDAGNGGRDAYTLHGEVWLPATVRVGGTYVSAPLVSRFDRVGCAVHSNERTTDYLYIREVIPHWVSPKNAAISFDDVLVVEWRKTADITTPPAEVYKLASGVGYVAWGGEGRDGAAVGELPDGRQPLGGKLTECV